MKITDRRPGIETQRSGFTLHIAPFPFNDSAYWSATMKDGTLTESEMQFMLPRLLTQKYIEETVGAMVDQEAYVSRAEVSIMQQGEKNGIFHVASYGSEGIKEFVFVAAKGKGLLSDETQEDYRNLDELYKKMKDSGVRPFIPKVYSAVEEEGLSGFSDEYLGETHTEMISEENKGLRKVGIPYAGMNMNSSRPDAQEFNTKQASNFRALLQCVRQEGDMLILSGADFYASEYHRVNNRIKSAVVARLYVVNQLTGCVPREFLINAGDVMVDLGKVDFDPKLITIRGDWKDMQPELFQFWIRTHQEYIGLMDRDCYPLFDPQCIAEGIEEGKALLGK